ncbi:ATP-dependent zinc metalloprotease FtsH [Methanobrevibacter cuticularis]|uniref:ATP-dependent zinc metalloprotease FtsH n=1 Tax=Methanobrevibacter cuticularis TaxID=47311 RepID=A0A166CPK9_9EURY|nr:AAA family ATPase [Methanobrevibacter cuticularis]KZX14733.1 ATP-dependent zinc metalloprotease FtsH [Methanobrevibacter cuticularis]
MKFNNKTQDSQSTNNKVINVKFDSKKEAKAIVLQGIGYPFNFPLMESHNLEVSDKNLFECYAKEQWLGLEVVEGSYLFDQKIIPDYGFKVITAHPNNSIISENTSIVLISEETSSKNELEAITTDLEIKDIIGQDQAKNKCKIIMRYLESPEKFGKWAPRNILFYGVPGTGKTMLAKSLANELNVPLYLIKATTLIGDHVGEGASQIHNLFELALKTQPSVIFIDEIDAIALHRKFQYLRGDVSEVVNALLTEMDGIHENEGVVTIAATNNPEQLDYAVRSRFEDEFEFTLPNEKERIAILDKYIKTLPLTVEPTSKKLAKLTKGMSGRDLKEKILKSSLHNAISNDDDVISMEHINLALNKSKSENQSPKNMFV